MAMLMADGNKDSKMEGFIDGVSNGSMMEDVIYGSVDGNADGTSEYMMECVDDGWMLLTSLGCNMSRAEDIYSKCSYNMMIVCSSIHQFTSQKWRGNYCQ